MQEAIAALAQWEIQPNVELAADVQPKLTPEVQTGGARLSELLATPVESSGMTVEVVPGAVRVEQGPKVMGDIILAKLDAIGSEYKGYVSQAHSILEKPSDKVTLHEMMKLQMDMASVSLVIEVVGKGVQKSVQHIDTLSKLQ